MRIALIGATGQLGTALQARLNRPVAPFGHEHIEITDADNVQSALADAEPDCVINAAAYGLVDRAEEEPEAAYRVNALGPRNLARYCAGRQIPLLHVSTDYVFGLDSRKSVPYRETDPPGPLSVYGVGKLAGEFFVRSICRRHFVIRTCGLYGRRSGGRPAGNFVETMLRLAAERDELAVVDDQICTPTAVGDLAEAIGRLLETEAYGVYHATSAGETTWCGFAREIFRQRGIEVPVRPVSSAQFGAPAPRPGYSVLDCRKLAGVIHYELPAWQDALARYLSER